MSRFLRLPSFSPFWFWAGALAGSLFWYALTRIYPLIQQWKQQYEARKAERKASRLERMSGRWRRWLEQYLEKAHLAAPLFPLEYILITPKVMAPPPAYVPEGEYRPDDIATLTVPYTPDFPELGALYRYPTMSLPEALQGGANLLLLGRFGTGKSTALAHLALLAARNDERLGNLVGFLPLLIHAADLPLLVSEETQTLTALLEALARYTPSGLLKGLRRQLPQTLESGKALLLIDGADEMAPSRQPALAAFLQRVMEDYPQSRLIVAASPEHTDGLQALELHPVTLAPWSALEAADFLKHWGEAWQREVAPHFEKTERTPKALPSPLLNRWLLTPAPAYTPLELTLKAWSAYAGDVRGAGLDSAIEAYLQRALETGSRERAALEALALQLVLEQGDSVFAREAGKGSDVWKQAAEEARDDTTEKKSPRKKRKPKVRRLLPELVESGLLVEHAHERVGVVHPLIQAYLAGQVLAEEGGESRLLHGDWWEGRTATLGFLALHGKGNDVAFGLLDSDHFATHAQALAAGRALAFGGQALWREEILHYLADILTDVALALNLRARALVALTTSGEKGLGALFRKLMTHNDLTVRWLGALGAGAAHSTKSIPALSKLLSDPSKAVQRAAALALVATDATEALETVASLLLSGDDVQRRIAAEALANHPIEGYPTLREAIGLKDDLRVRRAAVYGLARVPAAWAQDLLARAQVEDSQWVVRDAAAAIIERGNKPSPFMPRQLPPLHEEPWLLAFAAERGMGAAPGQAAMKLLHRILEEGTPGQKEAALARVPFYPQENWSDTLYDILNEGAGPMRDAAFHTLWLLAIAGVQLPRPASVAMGDTL